MIYGSVLLKPPSFRNNLPTSMPNKRTDPLKVDPRIAFFDRLAATWDVEEQNPAETIRRLEALGDLLILRADENLLEVGCGTGQLTGWLAKQVGPGRVTAIDFSAAMIEKAQAKGGGPFRTADVCQDDLGRSEFDVVLCFHSFPHFRDQSAALRNLAGCLKPTGRLIVMHLNGRDAINAFHGSVGGVVGGDFLPADDQWETWLAAAGLKLVKTIDREDLFFLQAEPVLNRR
jgi:ubiquinone/menaquinone biosynthesis C-methylase UbiE